MTSSAFASPPLMRLSRPHPPHISTAFQSWGVHLDPHRAFPHVTALHTDPPLLRVARFLSPEQCRALIDAQSHNPREASLYLNYRLNRASGSCGFRAQVPPHLRELQPVLHRLRTLLHLRHRALVFEEGAWIRPTHRSVVVRDVTTVRYSEGEGVPSHVDGKDLTLLVCLRAPAAGGATVFGEHGVVATHRRGDALLYRSRSRLPHSAQPVRAGVKWVLQMLLDVHVRADEPDVDFRDGRVFVPSVASSAQKGPPFA